MRCVVIFCWRVGSWWWSMFIYASWNCICYYELWWTYTWTAQLSAGRGVLALVGVFSSLRVMYELLRRTLRMDADRRCFSCCCCWEDRSYVINYDVDSWQILSCRLHIRSCALISLLILHVRWTSTGTYSECIVKGQSSQAKSGNSVRIDVWSNVSVVLSAKRSSAPHGVSDSESFGYLALVIDVINRLWRQLRMFSALLLHNNNCTMTYICVQLSAELHDEALRILIRTSPETVDQLLTSRTSSSLGLVAGAPPLFSFVPPSLLLSLKQGLR